MTETEERLLRYVHEYADLAWPGLALEEPTADDLWVIEARSDGWANAHVAAGGDCSGCGGRLEALECGEKGAAAEYVETH